MIMSRTELYIVKKDGSLELYKEFGNSHRGASLLWSNLWKLFYPEFHFPHFNDDKNIELLWNLDQNSEVPRVLNILHVSTFDHMLIRKEKLSEFIEAIENVIQAKYFNDNGHFRDYPEVMKEIMKLEDVIAIGWNQTSVCCGVWDVYEECPTCGESSIQRGYNVLKDKDHQFLFEYLDEIEKEEKL